MSEVPLRKAAIELALHGNYKSYTFYEGRFTDRFVAACKDMVVVDCGVCYGYYTALALRAGARRVYAFEPNDERHGVHLRAAFGTNPKVILSTKALGKTEGSIQLFSRPGTFRSWAATSKIVLLKGNPNCRKAVPIAIPCVSLDKAVKEPVGVIKIDTEGCELQILTGATGILSEHKPIVFLELHSIGKTWLAELNQLLSRVNYVVFSRYGVKQEALLHSGRFVLRPRQNGD